MTRDEILHSLRRQLASAMCAAQALPVPRSPVATMLSNLLRHAFDLLDDDRSVDLPTAHRIAVHALAAWHASNTGAGRISHAA